MASSKRHHEFARGEWNPVHPSRKGELTARAKRAGISARAEAEKDAHMKGSSARAKKLRSQGVFAMNAQRGRFKHAGKRSRRRS
jgi:hypothetical protein